TGDIGAAVQSVLDKAQLGIVRELVGHGVGHDLHEPPEIPNYGFKGSGSILKEGMTIAIEPMATLGEWRVVIDPDGWTIRTRDGSQSAHFEDTILVTHDGCEILTRS
ncbi:MAG TPA: M24 family metallopeptidase, partial [Candidatus Saccharibacteria bacterium]|nr:M24 family metallopeptidase [Candidatus Saccharibacteria bacterium]